MMGVTNHWASFLAHKYNDKVEFWLFDSKNRVYWDLDDAGVQKFVQQLHEERIQEGKPAWNSFKIWVQENSIKDIIASTKILCQCLVGNETLQEVKINSDFDVLSAQFKELILTIPEIQEFIAKKQECATAHGIIGNLEIWAENFHHNMKCLF